MGGMKNPIYSAVLASALFSVPLLPQALPPNLGRKVQGALERAGGNAREIRAFLAGLSGEKLRAGRFLVAYMPVADLAALDAASLRENLELAFRARAEFPWGKKVPFSLFAHYVLPHRFAQEAFQRWRPFFFGEMKKLLKGCREMGDAVLAANGWCARRVKFIQTEWRDQTPLDVLESGYGRCEEMMEVTLAALRAAGIPARPCSAPWWVVYDNNHAWVEVWVDGAWHFIGGCESSPLDRTWFRGPARRAGMVVSVMYGSPETFDPGDRVYKVLPDAALINSTPVYTAAGTLAVRVLGRGGEPAAGCPFAVSVFNFGGLRALTTRVTGSAGSGSVVLGPGEFFLSAGKGRERAFQVVKVKPGETVQAILRLRDGAVPPRAFRLRYPTPAEADRMAARLPSRGGGGKPAFRPVLGPKPRLDLYAEGKDPALDRLIRGFSRKAQLEKILADARGRWREVSAGLKALGPGLLPLGFEFLERTSHLDRVEMTPAVLLDHVRGAVENRREGIPGAVFFSYVLNGRIDLENLGPWRGVLRKRFSRLAGKEAGEIVHDLLAWTEKNIKPYTRGRFGPFMNPGQVLVSRHALSRERAIFLVGALRSLGIPARKRPNRNEAEFWDGGVWKRAAPGREGGASPGEVRPSLVSLFLFRKGKPSFSSRGIAFSRFTAGRWNPLRRLSFQKKGDCLRVRLAPGEYLFTAGVRNPNGDPWIQTCPLLLEPGGTFSIGMNLDLPPGGGIFRFPVAGKLDRLPVLRTSGPVLDLEKGSKAGPLLLFLFLPSHEPSTRALPMVARAFPSLEKVGVKGVGLLLPGPGSGIPRGLPFPVYRAGWEAARALGIPAPPRASARLPSVLLLQKGGKPLLWTEGYETKLESLLEGAARMVRD